MELFSLRKRRGWLCKNCYSLCKHASAGKLSHVLRTVDDIPYTVDTFTHTLLDASAFSKNIPIKQRLASFFNDPVKQ
jgi:hypothetical protein